MPDGARRAYGDALSVIEKVTAGLKDESLRDTFMSSALVEKIRHQAHGESGRT
jgi:hypothetical protein